MPDQPPTPHAAIPAPEKPKTPVRWVFLAFSILLILAVLVIASSIWILHLA